MWNRCGDTYVWSCVRISVWRHYKPRLVCQVVISVLSFTTRTPIRIIVCVFLAECSLSTSGQYYRFWHCKPFLKPKHLVRALLKCVRISVYLATIVGQKCSHRDRCIVKAVRIWQDLGCCHILFIESRIKPREDVFVVLFSRARFFSGRRKIFTSRESTVRQSETRSCGFRALLIKRPEDWIVTGTHS